MSLETAANNKYEKKPLDEYVEFILKSGSNEAAYAEMTLKQEPFLHYHISNLDVETKYRGSGLGSKIIEKINAFLLDKNIPGTLWNMAETNFELYDIKTKEEIDIDTFYSRHGWVEYSALKNMIYNPTNTPTQELIRQLRAVDFINTPKRKPLAQINHDDID